MKTTQDLKNQLLAEGLTESHTSYFRGYVSRKSSGEIVPYKGRFGEGKALLTPNWQSSQYSYITYYLK